MRQSLEYLNSSVKRRLDILGGAAISALLIPPAAIAALASAIDTKSLNPIFKQVRVGAEGHPFSVYKLRTLPKKLEKEAVQTFGTFDPRASHLGMAMRESGIDEMPQLFNVLLGEMSLVGMRPLLQEDIDRLQDVSPSLFKHWYEFYSRAKPGLTGPSQILRHHYKVTTDEIWRDAMQLDIDYAQAASLRNDLRILGRTPLKMLGARVNMVDNSAEATVSSADTYIPAVAP